MLMTYTGSSPGRVSFPHLTGPEGRDGEADATEAGATMVSARSAVDRVPAATMVFFTTFSLPFRELHAEAQRLGSCSLHTSMVAWGGPGRFPVVRYWKVPREVEGSPDRPSATSP